MPVLPLYLIKRGRKNPEYNYNWNERFGFGLKNTAKKPIIWIHAVSVGEIRAAAKLIALIEEKYPTYQILVTQMTPTGRNTAKNLYPNVVLNYIPYDLPHAVINFYKTFKPKIGLIMETEIWPNLIHYAKEFETPLFLVNARLSTKSFNGYRKISYILKPTLNKFSAILSQDQTTQDNFTKLGFCGQKLVVGSTKFDLNVDKKYFELATELKEPVANKKIVIFASTRDGEEELIISNIKKPNYLIIIVPRHLERFKLVEELLIKYNIKYIKRSDDKPLDQDTQVLLGDSMGEMFMYYAMSDLAVMGGSINNFGGQNLIEPIFLNKPVILGPSTFNFAKIAKDAVQNKCAIQVEDVKECFKVIDRLFATDKSEKQKNNAEYNLMAHNCQLFTKQYQGASQQILDFISAYI
ncbi:MAG: 3-deoxy-D-manno-octulosonic acid transferase [Burkholderiales bacterium]|jgi:3-deoxy-D-manno-octulosonic-acid transferase|nr:3-deoxy-D-manno-octulosonic acid transferase [Burkholderiales bacterium]